jgi:hypothetical protein
MQNTALICVNRITRKVAKEKEDIILSALLTTSLKRTRIPLRFMRRRKASLWLQARKIPLFACLSSTQFLVIRGQSLNQTHFFFYRTGFGLLATETVCLIREMYFLLVTRKKHGIDPQTLRPAIRWRKGSQTQQFYKYNRIYILFEQHVSAYLGTIIRFNLLSTYSIAMGVEGARC